MYAVIQTGGKQYRVTPGDRLRVEKLPGDRGATITFDNILMVGGEGAARVGKPTVAGVTVTAQITAQDRAKKIMEDKGYTKQLDEASKGLGPVMQKCGADPAMGKTMQRLGESLQ